MHNDHVVAEAKGLRKMGAHISGKEATDLLAAALLDGDVMPAQFEPDRIARAKCAAVLKKSVGAAGP